MRRPRRFSKCFAFTLPHDIGVHRYVSVIHKIRPSNKIIRQLLRFRYRFRLIAPNPIGAETRYFQSDGFLFFSPLWSPHCPFNIS